MVEYRTEKAENSVFFVYLNLIDLAIVHKLHLLCSYNILQSFNSW